jgi:hypothetical protein
MIYVDKETGNEIGNRQRKMGVSWTKDQPSSDNKIHKEMWWRNETFISTVNNAHTRKTIMNVTH